MKKPEDFESQWETYREDESRHDRVKISFFDSDSFGMLFGCYVICWVAIIPGFVNRTDSSNAELMSQYESDVDVHVKYQQAYAHDVLFWDVMLTGECDVHEVSETACAGFLSLRSLALDDSLHRLGGFRGVVTERWQRLEYLMKLHGPRLLVSMNVVLDTEDVVRKIRSKEAVRMVHPSQMIPAKPELVSVHIERVIFLLYLIGGLIFWFLALFTLKEKPPYVAFTRHTYFSRAVGMLMWPFVVMWGYRGLVDAWDWCWWYGRFKRYELVVNRKRKQSEAQQRQKRLVDAEALEVAEQKKRDIQQKRIERLDDDLRGRYDAALADKLRLEQMILLVSEEAEAIGADPTDLAVMNQLQAELEKTPEEILSLHEEQDEREGLRRAVELEQISQRHHDRLAALVGDRRGRVRVSREITARMQEDAA